MANELLQIDADNDQDRAACDEWWRTTPAEQRLAVWNWLQQDFENPIEEVASRFAALAFGEAAARNKAR